MMGGIDVTVEETGRRITVEATAITTTVELEIAVPGIQGPPGEPGPPGPSGGGFLTHVQATPALVWTITHELGRRPVVAVEDLDGNEIDAGISRPDLKTVIITLGAATAGRAHLS